MATTYINLPDDPWVECKQAGRFTWYAEYGIGLLCYGYKTGLTEARVRGAAERALAKTIRERDRRNRTTVRYNPFPNAGA